MSEPHAHRESREGSDDELTFTDLDDGRALLDTPDAMPSLSTEKKVDADFFNKFDDDFDESDMLGPR